MNWAGLQVDYPQALLAGVGVVVLVAVLIAASTSTAAFGVYNPAWDGAGQLTDVAESNGAEASVTLNASEYGTVEPDQTVAVVLSPERSYGRDAEPLREFVDDGGTLVVAEDFGPHGNELLESVGASARFDGRLVRDEQNHGRSPALPVATNVTAAETTANLTGGVEQLTLNYGTVVRPNNATVLVGTSEIAYLDENRNGTVDDGERLDSYPVVTIEAVGDGRVIAISDPSIFINVMLERPGNRQFAENLLARETVLLDYSHAGSQPPLTVTLLQVRNTPVLQGGVVALAVAAILGGRRFLNRPAPDATRYTPDPERIATYLEQERGWDADRVERVTTTVWGRPAERDDNE